jgi:acetyltransferase-like isoleucine patch superfamily enzyme
MLQKIKSKIKKIIIIRSFYIIWKKYFGIRKWNFGYLAKDATITPPVLIGNPKNVFLYEKTLLSPNSEISAIRAKFIMKKNSGAADGLVVRTGNHVSVPGKNHNMITDADKDELDPNHEYDKDVVVEEDVWLAANVTLLSGVTIGRGAIVGAGAVVRYNVPPYAIVVGNPAKVVGFRFTPSIIVQHEEELYSVEERLSEKMLEENYKKYFVSKIKDIQQYLSL